ncbi:hypothetical protein GCM10022225_46640 [Plantactinospora mayteni]|uniref:Uncharacterized protein n=1 Tax=Plantactinospora mayteni TaxID=566021 RepID=A0ABQ4EX67_9ACTN|nr:hypothetical protein [Plantactinospora mayteni]GIG99257.1 hypothetical protein Pma05_58300 [Plantactinospora mayteni]
MRTGPTGGASPDSPARAPVPERAPTSAGTASPAPAPAKTSGKTSGKPAAGTALATVSSTSGNAGAPLRSSKRTWQLVIGSLGVLLLLGICGLSSYFFVVDDPVGRDSRAADGTGAGSAPRDISSRAADPAPLTVKEVFPGGKEVLVDPEQSPYELLKTQEAEDCELAGDGQLTTVLRDAGCSQFVRGTVRSPTGLYVATAGMVNLADEAGATSARDKIKPIVDGRKGRFLGLAAGRGTEAVTAASAQAGWHVRGHFLIYCVVAKTDGKTIGEADLFARQILSDMIEVYLRGKVLDQRTIAPSGPPSPAQSD